MNLQNNNRKKLLSEFLVYRPEEDLRRVRFGRDSDGGYVLLDYKLQEAEAFYSYGISDEFSFDQELSETLKIPGRLFDPTVDYSEKITDLLHFRKIGLACGDGSVSEHIRHFGDSGKKKILKIDVEGAEWSWLKDVETSELKEFDQILIEFHDLDSEENCLMYIEGLKKLNALFYLVHVHGNNYIKPFQMESDYFPSVLECTYIKKEICSCEINNSVIFPIFSVDFSNNPYVTDYQLSHWPFIAGADEELTRTSFENAKSIINQIDLFWRMDYEKKRLQHELKEIQESKAYRVTKLWREFYNRWR